MYVLGNLIGALASVLDAIFSLYTFVVLGAIITTWVNADPRNQLVRVLHALTDPVFYRVRKTFPFLVAGAIDFTPMALLLVIMFVQRGIISSLHQFAFSLSAGM